MRITSWAPVTNMYETVIWVALVAAVLSFIFEMIYRKVFIALAGSAVALLGTITAANVPASRPEHQKPSAGAAKQPLADDSRSHRGLELCRVRPGVDARTDRDDVLPDRHLPPLASFPRTWPSLAPGVATDAGASAGPASPLPMAFSARNGRSATRRLFELASPRPAATPCSTCSPASPCWEKLSR